MHHDFAVLRVPVLFTGCQKPRSQAHDQVWELGMEMKSYPNFAVGLPSHDQFAIDVLIRYWDSSWGKRYREFSPHISGPATIYETLARRIDLVLDDTAPMGWSTRMTCSQMHSDHIVRYDQSDIAYAMSLVIRYVVPLWADWRFFLLNDWQLGVAARQSDGMVTLLGQALRCACHCEDFDMAQKIKDLLRAYCYEDITTIVACRVAVLGLLRRHHKKP